MNRRVSTVKMSAQATDSEPEFTISHVDENDPNVGNFMDIEFRDGGEPAKMGRFDRL